MLRGGYFAMDGVSINDATTPLNDSNPGLREQRRHDCRAV
jgi:hypothetical protein